MSWRDQSYNDKDYRFGETEEQFNARKSKFQCLRCEDTGWLEPIGPCYDGSYITSRPCPCGAYPGLPR